MERIPDWHAIGSRIQLLLVILYLIFELAEGQDTEVISTNLTTVLLSASKPKDECKSLHPVACVLYKEKIELFEDVTACTQHTEFKNYCPSLCPPCVVHEHHVNETCFKDVAQDCEKQMAGNKTNCKDLTMFLHCHQTCTDCQPSWQDSVLKFLNIGNNTAEEENSNSTNSTGENKEDNSTSHSWEEMKKDPLKNITLPSAENNENNTDTAGQEENSQDSVEDNKDKGNSTEIADPGDNSQENVVESKENLNDTQIENVEEIKENVNSTEEDSNADKCEDSNDLCKTPELLGTFLKIALKEDQDPCEETAIQVMCRSTCKKCGDPDAEVPSLEKFKEMRQFVADKLAPIVDFFSTFFTKFV